LNSHDPELGRPLRLGAVLYRRRHGAGDRPHRLSDAHAANAMTGDQVVLVTAVVVLLLALMGAALISWWVWQGGAGE